MNTVKIIARLHLNTIKAIKVCTSLGNVERIRNITSFIIYSKDPNKSQMLRSLHIYIIKLLDGEMVESTAYFFLCFD